jgi:hypothetical protein
MVSPFAKSEVSDAVVCLRPKKNIAGAIAAPIIEVVITMMRILKLFFLLESEEDSVCNDKDEDDDNEDVFLFLNATIALKGIADIRYNNDDSNNGFTVSNTGFAIVDTEPKRAAAMSAAVKPIPSDFVLLIILNTAKRAYH